MLHLMKAVLNFQCTTPTTLPLSPSPIFSPHNLTLISSFSPPYLSPAAQIPCTAASSKSNSDASSGQCRMGACLAVGFAAGSTADRISSLPPCEVFARSLRQLDSMLGARDCDCSECDCNDRVLSASAVSGGNGGLHYGVRFESRRDEENPGGTWVYPTSMNPTRNARGACCNAHQSAFHGGKHDLCSNAMEERQEGRSSGCARCRPASYLFVKGYLVDWSKDPHILGGYSHPTIGACGARGDLSRPVNNMLFFAGEATHHGVNPCLQAALDSGCRAANQAFLALESHAKL